MKPTPPQTLWEVGINLNQWRLFIRVTRWASRVWGVSRKRYTRWGWNIDLGRWRVAGGVA